MASSSKDGAASAAAPVPTGPIDCLVMATGDEGCNFQPARVQRRPLGPRDVLIDMKYCGVCHTDLHYARGGIKAVMGSAFPAVPGHELAGVAVAVGPAVTRVKVGDHVGVGCMVDACLNCAACRRGEEQWCSKKATMTYGGKNTHGRAATYPAGGPTLGGYSTKHVVDERFAVVIPKAYPLEAAGPLMCAGITVYDPIRKAGVKAGTRVGVAGIGGLGVMAIRIAKALGATVTAVTRSAAKGAFAKAAGADAVVLSTSPADMKAAAGSIDLLLNTIPAPHDHHGFRPLLSGRGKQVILGLHAGLVEGVVAEAVAPCGGSHLVASSIGGVKATQEMVDLCAREGIMPIIKVVPVEGLNGVYEKLAAANDSGDRFVLDLSTLDDAAFDRCKGVPPPKMAPEVALTGGAALAAVCRAMCCCGWA
jgi:alcohol dehydrogenase (NADP+)